MNRNNFLKLSSLSLVSTLLPFSQVKHLSFILDLKDKDISFNSSLVELADEARKAFYRKEYSLAEELFLQCISSAPKDIRFYDNLQNVYGKQNKVLEIIELYNNGLTINSENIAFYDRTARSLMRLELGYKRQAAQYREQISSNSLLSDAQSLYLEALNLQEMPYLHIGLEKVLRKIETNAVGIDYTRNEKVIQERKQRRINHRERYNNFSNAELLSKTKTIDATPRRHMYFENEEVTRLKSLIKEKKIIYRILIDRFSRNKEYDQAIIFAKEIYELDKNDTAIKNTLKTLYKFTENYEELVNFKMSYVSNSENVYDHLGLMWALNEYYRGFGDVNTINQSINIGENLLENWNPILPALKVSIIDKLCITYNLVGSYQKSIDLISETLLDLPTKSSGLINDLLYRYGNTLKDFESFGVAKDYVLMCLEKSAYDSATYPQFYFLNNVLKLRNKNTFFSNIKLWYLLYEVYEKNNYLSKCSEVVNTILANDPDNLFANKRKYS